MTVHRMRVAFPAAELLVSLKGGATDPACREMGTSPELRPSVEQANPEVLIREVLSRCQHFKAEDWASMPAGALHTLVEGMDSLHLNAVGAPDFFALKHISM